MIQKMLEKIDESERSTLVSKILEITKKKKQINNSAKIVLKSILNY